MTINHLAQAEKYLSQASWFKGTGPDAVFTNPESAAILATLANAHASLAHLPEQQVHAHEQLAEAQRDLEATRRVVGSVIAETLADGPTAAQQWASNLAYALRSRHVSVDGVIEARMEDFGRTYDPDAEVKPAAADVPTVDRVPYEAAFLSCRKALVDFIAHGLASGSDSRWEEMTRLLSMLNMIGLSMDGPVDYVLDHHTDAGLRARIKPSERHPDLSRDPWAPKVPPTRGPSDEPPF